MKKVTLIAIGAVALWSCGAGGESTSKVTLNNNIDSVSYAIGINSANGLSAQFAEGNMDAYLKGFKDAIDSNELMIATEDAQGIIQAFSQKKQAEQMAKQQEEQEAMYGSVKEEGIKFLEEDKTKEGVVTTASGLQYIVLKEGSGDQPVATSNVEVHYHGTTPDGKVFDSSVDRGETISFALNQVIPGWTEGVALMKVGAKYRFFIPQELAYGANPPGGGQGDIKPFMPLVFEVELFKINS
jgi:FKBP-type peptidyl-prolyl cis-trans isomerase FklB